jgi:hypothetical protein
VKSLALAYTNQGKNADAEALYERALAIPVQQMGLRFAALVRERQDLSASGTAATRRSSWPLQSRKASRAPPRST